jgi:sodium transport system ATP-binding protein
MIEIQHLHKRFGDVTAVNGVSFTASDAAITGLLGANGAGKTTTLGMITGLLAPDSGTVSVGSTTSNGRDRRSLIGALLDHQGLYPRLTARENIAYFGELQGLSGPALGRRVTELVSALGLEAFADRRAEGFSRGERLKVALGRALVHAPQHLVLDEPTSGLDVASVHSLRALLRRLRDEGRCVVFSSHVLDYVAALCDIVVIMAKGRLVARGSVEALCTQAGATTLEDAFMTLTSREA